jgi:threonine dehydratase
VSEEARLADELGYLDVQPFDHPLGIAGQGTAVFETLREHPEIAFEAVVCPVGGGGLAAGSALAVRAMGASAAIHGVEPEGADDTARSFAAGHPVTIDRVASVADALLSRRPGTTTFPINYRELAGIHVVTDEAILCAAELLRTRTKQVVEPSGAVSLASVLAGHIPGDGPVLVVLSGGNAA